MYYNKNGIQLYHGDCLEVMDQLIQEGVKVDAVITDPPYGTTACKWDNIIPFDEMWKRLKLLRKDRTPIVLFGSEPFSSALRMSNIKEYKYDWIWKKERGLGFLNAKKMPLRDTENITVFYKKPSLYNPQMRKGTPYVAKNNPSKQKGTNNNYDTVTTTNTGDRYPLTTLEFTRPRRTFHPTQKPVALMEYLIKTYTNEGDTVLDFTAGSGSTGVACQNTGRNCILIEKELEDCEITVKRLEGVYK